MFGRLFEELKSSVEECALNVYLGNIRWGYFNGNIPYSYSDDEGSGSEKYSSSDSSDSENTVLSDDECDSEIPLNQLHIAGEFQFSARWE